jgi:hypothetical protein
MSFFIIHPYKNNIWQFDDPVLNIKNEEFLSGSELFLEEINKSFPPNNQSFILMLSDKPFEDASYVFEWQNDSYKFNNLTGKLPQKLINYFKKKPTKIFVSAFRKQDL